MSLFAESLSVINNTLKAVAGEQIVYGFSVIHSSGFIESSGTVSLTAVPTNSRFQMVNEVGSVIEELNIRDWLVQYEDLGRYPQLGDRISGSGYTYDISAPDGQEVWRWTDAHQTLMRIHSVRTQ